MLKYAVAFVLLFPAVAYADKIDGAWCNPAGRIDIDGSKITLSGKDSFEGEYHRHQFFYTVPAGEEHAGDQMFLQLMNDEEMTSYVIKDGKNTDPVSWKRCAETS